MSANTNWYFLNSVESWLRDLRQEVHCYEFDKQNQVNYLMKMTSNITESRDESQENPYVNIWECIEEKPGENSTAKSSLQSLEHLSENSNYLSESSAFSSSENVPITTKNRANSEGNLNITNEQNASNKMANSEPNIVINTEIPGAMVFENYSLPNDLNHRKNKSNENLFMSSQDNSVEFVSIDTIDNVDDYTERNQNCNYLESIESLIDNLFDFEEAMYEETKEDDFLSVKSDLGSLENASINSNIIDIDQNASYDSQENMDDQILESFENNTEYFVKLRKKYHINKPLYEEKLLKAISLPNINQRFPITPVVDRKSYRNAQILLEVPSFTIRSTKDLSEDVNFAKVNSVSTIFETERVHTLEDIPGTTENVCVEKEDEFVEFLREDVVSWITKELRYRCEDEDEYVFMEQQELLKSIHQFPSKCDKSSQIPKFPPAVDDNAVEIRRKSTARNPRCSRTVDLGKSQLISKHQDTKYFEIKGLVKFQLPDQTIITKLNQDYISYENGSFYKKGTNRLSKDLLRRNVIIKSVRYLNKNKEVELRDSLNLSYVIYFDSPKYAKQFMDNDVIQEFVEENSTNAITIKKRLLGFLGRRSTREDLEKIGIIKNEPIFGNTLRAIYQKGGSKFIYKVIELIERPENMKSLGLYRTSGNLAMIQKIRFQVDNGKLEILDQFARDPDVLTGSLKLFFRELKEPLISMEACEELMNFAKKDPLKLTPQEISKINTILTKNLHDANRETLYVLIRHLIEVVKHKNDNKMDTYNLSVCWGPSIMFQVVTSPSAMEKCFDLVTQSQDAMRLVEFLLSFYLAYPEELSLLGTTTDFSNDRLNCSKQQTSSKESLDSSCSQKSKSASDQNLHIDDVVKKAIDLIELSLPCEDLYTKVVSSDKASKILKKLTKKKETDTERHKIEPTDAGEALKKYLRDSQDWLITREVFDKVLSASKDYHGLYLDPYTRDRVTKTIETLPKKDTFIFLMRHLAKLFEDKNKSKIKQDELYLTWTKVLNHQKRISSSDENFIKFLQVCTKVFDSNSTNNLPDLVPHAELLKDLKSEQQRIATLSKKRTQSMRVSESDRYSRYDNIDFDIGEAQILDDIEDKTEDTKL